MATTFPRYVLSSVGAITFPDGLQIECPDGTIVPTSKEQDDYLAAAVKVGNVRLCTEEIAQAIISKELTPKIDFK